MEIPPPKPIDRWASLVDGGITREWEGAAVQLPHNETTRPSV